jgi:hypothetical protein
LYQIARDLIPPAETTRKQTGSRALPPALKPLLLGNCPLGSRDYLEPLVGDRLTALDGQPVASAPQAVLGPLERLKLASQLVDAADINALLVEVRCVVGKVGARELVDRLEAQARELVHDSLPLRLEQLTCSSVIHEDPLIGGTYEPC